MQNESQKSLTNLLSPHVNSVTKLSNGDQIKLQASGDLTTLVDKKEAVFVQANHTEDNNSLGPHVNKQNILSQLDLFNAQETKKAEI